MGDLERAVSAPIDRLLDANHRAGAQVLTHVSLNRLVETLDHAATTGQQHPILELLLKFGVEGRHELAEALHNRGDHATAGGAHAFCDIKAGWLAIDRQVHHDRPRGGFHGGVALLDGLDHLLGVLGVRVGHG